jgi:hypothetical protein
MIKLKNIKQKRSYASHTWTCSLSSSFSEDAELRDRSSNGIQPIDKVTSEEGEIDYKKNPL